MKPMKTILVICDGLGDRPIAGLGGKTPLEAAVTPNFDRMAKEGVCGKMSVMGPGVVPHSDDAHLTLFGYDLKRFYPGRGPIEAAGIGFKLKDGDVAFRSNVGTVDKDWVVLDRRAGRIESTKAFAEKLDGMEIDGVKFFVKPATGYRMVIVMRSENKKLSDKITDCDPHEDGKVVQKVAATDNSGEAEFTASVLNKFLQKAYLALKDLPINKERVKKGLPAANFPLMRGAGYHQKIPSFSEKYGAKACCIAGAGLYKGIGAILGMDVLQVKGATGLPDTNVKAKFLAAKKALKKYDFVFVHVKPTDSLGEDGNIQGKKEFIEKIDKALPAIMDAGGRIVITADHSTPCECKAHSADPVPLLIRDKSIEPDKASRFSEKECEQGRIGLIDGKDFMKTILAEKI